VAHRAQLVGDNDVHRHAFKQADRVTDRAEPALAPQHRERPDEHGLADAIAKRDIEHVRPLDHGVDRGEHDGQAEQADGEMEGTHRACPVVLVVKLGIAEEPDNNPRGNEAQQDRLGREGQAVEQRGPEGALARQLPEKGAEERHVARQDDQHQRQAECDREMNKAGEKRDNQQCQRHPVCSSGERLCIPERPERGCIVSYEHQANEQKQLAHERSSTGPRNNALAASGRPSLKIDKTYYSQSSRFFQDVRGNAGNSA